MFDPPIASGANIFIIVSVCIIAVVAAIAAVDIYKNTMPKKKQSDKN